MIVGGHYFIMCWCGGWRPFKLFRHLRTILNCDCASLVKCMTKLFNQIIEVCSPISKA